MNCEESEHIFSSFSSFHCILSKANWFGFVPEYWYLLKTFFERVRKIIHRLRNNSSISLVRWIKMKYSYVKPLCRWFYWLTTENGNEILLYIIIYYVCDDSAIYIFSLYMFRHYTIFPLYQRVRMSVYFVRVYMKKFTVLN